MATGNALHNHSVVAPPSIVDDSGRTSLYGGVVGQMIEDIDFRLSRSELLAQVEFAPQDIIHRISVVCGYVGLIAGFGFVGFIAARAF